MNLQRQFELVYGQPWEITLEAWYDMHRKTVERHQSPAPAPQEIVAPVERERRPTVDYWGDPIDQMEILEGVIARIPIKSTLVKGASPSEKYFWGYTSYEDIQEDLDTALEKDVKAIILDVHSPGGMVTGNVEVAERIADIRDSGVLVFAYTEGLMASAAYKISCGATQLCSTPSAIVGSIGTLYETLNVAEYLKKFGIEAKVYASGTYKALAHPLQRMPDAHDAWLKEFVETRGAQFRQWVTLNRGPQVTTETMQGQIFTGDQGVTVGLVDDLVSSIDEVFEQVLELI